MNNFFATPEGAWGDGSVHLTTVGLIIMIAIAVLLIAASLVVRHQKKNSDAESVAVSKKAITTKQLVFSAVSIALAVVTSMIKFANLPMGGSVTLFSMLFIVLIGYWYGPSIGIMTALAYGLLQFILEPIFYTIPQMILDYPLAFGALGLSGFFYKKKHGLQIGYVVGVLGRFIFATISGVVFFGSYAPEGTPALVYSLGYQASYLVPEAVVTLILISIPAVSSALAHVKKIARADA
ncbi:MAG: energy-coupled thiamine transporter ThiT [Roseburia sp.]